MSPSANSSDQWYYLEGSETRGPVPSAEIARLIKSGKLSAATQVAQAGWPNWSPASVALAHLLSASSAVAPQPEQPVYAIKIHCISGPDAGKAYVIGMNEVALGRVSGIGQNDPQIAENHVALSWQNNVLQFRTLGGKLRVAGNDVTQGSLSNGQQFQLGASTWQVGSAPVELGNLLHNLGARLNKLTNTEKLEGFSLTTMFSEVFKGRKPGEIEDYFVVGTSKTTPPLNEVQTGWPKPWFFMRVFIFLAAVYILFSKLIDLFGNPKEVPGLMIIGALAVPLATAMFVWELNTPRNVSFVQVLMLVCLGGVISLIFTEIGNEISHLGFLGAPSAGIIEEIGKILTVVLVVGRVRYKYILNGMVFGAAIGAGFAAFETAGYALVNGFLIGVTVNAMEHLEQLAQLREMVMKTHNYKILAEIAELIGGSQAYQMTFDQLNLRAYFAPFGHVIWTSIAAGALWRVKGANAFHVKMLFDPSFIRVFLIPVGLHMIWDTDLVQGQGPIVSSLLMLGLGVIAWYVAFLLVQQGLKQIKQTQVSDTQAEYTHTREILSTTGRFRTTGTAQ
jgi:RsiW-degrading membrane proteinase PrsW (M82 family)